MGYQAFNLLFFGTVDVSARLASVPHTALWSEPLFGFAIGSPIAFCILRAGTLQAKVGAGFMTGFLLFTLLDGLHFVQSRSYILYYSYLSYFAFTLASNLIGALVAAGCLAWVESLTRRRAHPLRSSSKRWGGPSLVAGLLFLPVLYLLLIYRVPVQLQLTLREWQSISFHHPFDAAGRADVLMLAQRVETMLVGMVKVNWNSIAGTPVGMPLTAAQVTRSFSRGDLDLVRARRIRLYGLLADEFDEGNFFYHARNEQGPLLIKRNGLNIVTIDVEPRAGFNVRVQPAASQRLTFTRRGHSGLPVFLRSVFPTFLDSVTVCASGTGNFHLRFVTKGRALIAIDSSSQVSSFSLDSGLRWISAGRRSELGETVFLLGSGNEEAELVIGDILCAVVAQPVIHFDVFGTLWPTQLGDVHIESAQGSVRFGESVRELKGDDIFLGGDGLSIQERPEAEIRIVGASPEIVINGVMQGASAWSAMPEGLRTAAIVAVLGGIGTFVVGTLGLWKRKKQ